MIEEYLERIRKHDRNLGAFIDVYEEDARKAASASDMARSSGHIIGPLHGIPVAVKDVIDIEGKITTGGSMVWKDRRSSLTATLVRRMVEAGMIVLGKTHTVEFAMGSFGTNKHMGSPKNPWDLEEHRATGGSSAGTASAVAAGLTPWGIGTDTGGSVRIPSAWCGLTGLKNSVGRISTHGILPLSHTLDTPGPMCRSVQDAAILYRVLAGPDEQDLRTLIHPVEDPFPELKKGISGFKLVRVPDSELENVDSENLEAYDSGPGNCLIDEWIRKNSNKNFDLGGSIAKSGKINQLILNQIIDNFKIESYEKSLDIKDFDISFARGLSLEDGCATITNFTAYLIAKGIEHSNLNGTKPIKYLVCGGGRKNSFLIQNIKDYLSNNKNISLDTIDKYSYDGDYVESQAFGYLAIRSFLNLPISFPKTTGCKTPTVGGKLVKNF